MEKSYKLKVDGQLEYELDEKQISTLDIQKTGEDSLHLLHEGKSFHIKFLKSNFYERTYTVDVNGSAYVVEIDTPLDVLIDKMGFAKNGAKNINSISAPMPGLILDISVAVGTEVQEDDQLIILEAMKMENIITSPRNGTIKKIAVSKGDAVDKKQLLIEFE